MRRKTKAEQKIHTVMKEFANKTLNIGKSKKKVTKRKQAVAIALNMARKKGLKTPLKSR
jgi:hypothetical protein